MIQLLFISAGGALGAITRFLALSSTTALLGNDFPYGTLIVNVVGSFFAGVLVVLILEKGIFSDHMQSFLLVGFLGSLTTFSTFSMETVAFINELEWLKAMGNIFLNLSLCLSATFLGIYLTKGAI